MIDKLTTSPYNEIIKCLKNNNYAQVHHSGL